ncbi:PREDICTED: adipocyte plasma membrane-associated protein [Vollenhovia emeryi]|uniref:adipocyte plasma membrane-associated protein n=1 Tax=Vollenhovia emeryi TaxID=411798 RepID=UPI0005F43047|nr:PREDICTED: adipocyte plasma membrane-associated protein [Vollenhovia emeryi]
MSYLKPVGTFFIYLSVILAVITFLPGLPPDAEFREYSVIPSRKIDPKLGPKNRLNGVEKLFVGELIGPESFDVYNGQLYTGVHGGYVVRIEEDHFVPIVKFGEKCDGIWQERKCGRPLGMKFDKKGNLYVMDAYYGVFKVNVATGDYKNIVNISKPIDGKPPLLPNSIDIAENGDLYWTDSSTDFRLYDLVLTFLANPSGRLIRYDAAKKKNEVLVRNLGFANGLKLSDDESFLIVAETQMSRIIRYNLKGPKAGQHEVFIDGLPGSPDNIKSDGQGGFLVSLVITKDSEHPNLVHSFMPHPNLRKLIARLLVLMELPFKLLHDIYPNTYSERLMHAIGSFQGCEGLIDSRQKSLLFRLDASGNIIEVLSGDDGSYQRMSEAQIHNGFLWFGSPWLNYLSRVPLKQAFPDLADSAQQSSRVRYEKQSPDTSGVKTERVKRSTDSTTTKPTAIPTTTPKPTAAPTTTPKPTTAPTTPKPTAAPKPSPAPKTDTAGSGSVKSSEAKKDNAKTVGDDAGKTQSGKNVKVEQGASVKQTAQKSQPEKAKRETNRPRDDL